MSVRRTAPQEVKSKIIEHSPAKSKKISEYEEKKKVQLCTEGGDCLQDIHVKKGNVVKWVHKELIPEASDPTPEKPIEPQQQEPEKTHRTRTRTRKAHSTTTTGATGTGASGNSTTATQHSRSRAIRRIESADRGV